MKPLPSNNGNTELKAKAIEILVLLHGLRHENLNPLIGKFSVVYDIYFILKHSLCPKQQTTTRSATSFDRKHVCEPFNFLYRNMTIKLTL